VIIDPKKVEMTYYGLLKNHFLALSPDTDEHIITTPQNAVAVLKSLCVEMMNRYEILAKVGQRNIVDYNQKVKEGKYKDSGTEHSPMPYIVCVIDELADLMLTAGREVEEPIISTISQSCRYPYDCSNSKTFCRCYNWPYKS
jgi:S-DNA-T family DNA segregation ATPase FtsK/SpoIIIE